MFIEQAEHISVAMTAGNTPSGSQGPEAGWLRVTRRLRAELGEDVFSSWFARVELNGIEGGQAHLTVPTRFLKSWLESHFLDRLRSHCAAELGTEGGVTLAVRHVSRELNRAAVRSPQTATPLSSPAPTMPVRRLQESTQASQPKIEDLGENRDT
ncbi:MAG: DnaA N-terminal domain-containing protein, partial [Bosea sp. (in: a-proteobacteria)]